MLQPWYKIVSPREDLREGRPLDASEFAVHLDQVRDGSAPSVYQKPAEFFKRTHTTVELAALAVEAIRRLNGIKVETSPVFNLTTQFGGGKTHALTFLYHLARGGSEATEWQGVRELIDRAGVKAIPQAATAVFVGTEFDSLTGRGGVDGTPLRRTPWGEMAWQLSGGDVERFRLIEEHETQGTAPGGDVIQKLFPAEKPALLLFDEVMNYVSRERRSGLAGQLHSFLHSLSEVTRTRHDVVLAVSIPASELEMSPDDQSDYERFKKLLDRLGKSVLMSAQHETSEIIRRRLFEWEGLPSEASPVLDQYANWVIGHRTEVPSWFPVDHAQRAFAASYPFHPTVLSVFERKWQGLPRFQQTRGILRLLALWVSHAYTAGYRGVQGDPLITLGTAPLEDPTFRSAVFEQLGEARLEAAVTTDIVGKDHAHAVRLDREASASEGQGGRLHRKVATTVFFESNGGQQRGEATLPEIRLAVAEPDLELGNIEQALEALTSHCYYLSAERARYSFSLKPNLNKLLADRRAVVSPSDVERRVREETVAVFKVGKGFERVAFPGKSADIPDRPMLTLVILSPDQTITDDASQKSMLTMTRDYGESSRSFKSALVWCVAEEESALSDEARKVLAWEDIQGDRELKLDDPQYGQLEESMARAKRDLREAVWRAYKNVFFLDEDNSIRRIDLGLVHSSSGAGSLSEFIVNRLQQEDIVSQVVSPRFLVRNWPPALPEWSTKGVRDAFFASPRFPRLLDPNAIRRTIVEGVQGGILAYVGKPESGRYEPFRYKVSMLEGEVEIDEEMFIIPAAAAEEYLARVAGGGAPEPEVTEGGSQPAAGGVAETPTPADADEETTTEAADDGPETLPGFRWRGQVDARKWMNFYTKVLTSFATSPGMTLTIEIEVAPPQGVTPQKVAAVRAALRDLGLEDDLEEG